MATTIEELEKRRELARLGGGEKRIAAQHAKGRLTARERLSAYCSIQAASKNMTCSSSIIAPTSAWRSRRSPATAWSPARARSTAAWSMSSRRISPSSAARLSERHAQKICKVMDMAMKVGAPVIGLND